MCIWTKRVILCRQRKKKTHVDSHAERDAYRQRKRDACRQRERNTCK